MYVFTATSGSPLEFYWGTKDYNSLQKNTLFRGGNVMLHD